MPPETPITVPRELVLEAFSRAARDVLVESGLVRELSDVQAVLKEIRLLKEGMLTADQAATMLQISVRTFKRQVKAKLWPEDRTMGPQEYRYPLEGMRQVMARNLKHAKGATVPAEPTIFRGGQKAA